MSYPASGGATRVRRGHTFISEARLARRGFFRHRCFSARCAVDYLVVNPPGFFASFFAQLLQCLRFFIRGIARNRGVNRKSRSGGDRQRAVSPWKLRLALSSAAHPGAASVCRGIYCVGNGCLPAAGRGVWVGVFPIVRRSFARMAVSPGAVCCSAGAFVGFVPVSWHGGVRVLA